MTKPTSSNLVLWDALRTVDPEYAKRFDTGSFKGTAIDPQYRWWRLTKQFGPAGVGWGVDSYKIDIMDDLPDGQKMACVTVVGFYVVDGERRRTPPGFGQDYIIRMTRRGLKADDEGIKKAFTDALGNAFKYIGLGADVYMGKFDDDKYVRKLTAERQAGAEWAAPKGDEETPRQDEPRPPAEGAPAAEARAQDAPDEWPEVPENRRFLMEYDPEGDIVVAKPQKTDEDKANLANLAAWYIEQIPAIDMVIAFCRTNRQTLAGLRMSNGDEPVEHGAHAWATARLKRIKTARGLEMGWKRISVEVNSVRNEIPELFAGLVRAFAERKAEIKNGEDKT